MNLAKNTSAENLPCSFVIFGATGNLASNKLLPALYHLEAAARLSESLIDHCILAARMDDGSLARAHA